MIPQGSDIAIRRKRDGWYYGGRSGWRAAPKFLQDVTMARLQTIVRVDIGDDLADYEFPTRAELRLLLEVLEP